MVYFVKTTDKTAHLIQADNFDVLDNGDLALFRDSVADCVAYFAQDFWEYCILSRVEEKNPFSVN